MDIVLLAVTVVSLLVAVVMSAAAWRLARDERARSAARVAALAAAADESDSLPLQRGIREPGVAAVATEALDHDAPVAATRPAAPWAPARVPAFSAETRASAGVAAASTPLAPSPAAAAPIAAAPAAGTPGRAQATLGDSFLGSAVAAEPRGGPQRMLAIAACVLFVAVVSGGYWTMKAPASVSTAARADAAALELVSLRHERQGSRLSINGLVRNPAGGAPVERLAAVAFLFDQQGSFLTSSRAAVDFTQLAAGDESPFVIALDAPANVARYRVSFRTEAGVVPHVDRRGQEPIARDLP